MCTRRMFRRFVLPQHTATFLAKCRVVAQLVGITGWTCLLCKASNSKSMARCGDCGGPKEAHPGLLGQPSLVRMPSDLDPAFFLPPPEERAALDELKSAQRAAMDGVVRWAQRQSNEARGPLAVRLQGMGYAPVFAIVACFVVCSARVGP